jgi:hypothetical protein
MVSSCGVLIYLNIPNFTHRKSWELYYKVSENL